MLPIKKILVALDSTAMDETLISFVSFVLQTSQAEHVYFVNILNSSEDVPGLDFKKLDKQVIEAQESQIRKQIVDNIPVDAAANLHVIVKKGYALREVLKLSSKEDIDIIISGSKKTIKGSGIFNMRLARRAPCSLIVIPEGHVPTLDKLLIPIDFSLNSQLALEYGIYISKNHGGNVEIICQNVYKVPTGYHYSGKSFKEFGAVMRENAEKEYVAWISKIDTSGIKITPVFSLDSKDDFGNVIKKEAMSQKASGLLIGAKGRTAASALFIGSTAEKLIQAIDYLPLTIVRKKGSNATLLQSLREL